MSIPYTYLIINKTTNLAYYGVQFGKTANPNNLWKNYFTSSKIIKQLIKLYGIDDFYIQIRKTFYDKLSAIKWESTVNRRLTSKSNKFCNIDNCQQPHKAIQNNIKCKRISNIKLNVCLTVPINFKLPDNWVLGNIKLKGNVSNKNKKWCHNPITLESKMIFIHEIIPEGWIPNRPKTHSNTTTLKNKNLIWITNGSDSKQQNKDIEIPKEWYKGRTLKNKPTGKRKEKYTWVTNGKVNKLIPINSNISDNFYKGRIRQSNWKPIKSTKGYKFTIEQREYLSKTQRGKVWWNNGIKSIKAFEAPDKNWIRGKCK